MGKIGRRLHRLCVQWRERGTGRAAELGDGPLVRAGTGYVQGNVLYNVTAHKGARMRTPIAQGRLQIGIQARRYSYFVQYLVHALLISAREGSKQQSSQGSRRGNIEPNHGVVNSLHPKMHDFKSKFNSNPCVDYPTVRPDKAFVTSLPRPPRPQQGSSHQNQVHLGQGFDRPTRSECESRRTSQLLVT
ncbi:hypothetical protein B0T24DRAFT_592790 [Lasiosphaeria ovina]|uniref:Uncharacterized protein n=1 Tax=Lasiosphaeria ovina TaxID=92902 RepID=A0AAE0KJ34_9PEZI|nr:hypothetical protein B0T24DRAFT_592790 [Lasiosphaeria ovina]